MKNGLINLHIKFLLWLYYTYITMKIEFLMIAISWLPFMQDIFSLLILFCNYQFCRDWWASHGSWIQYFGLTSYFMESWHLQFVAWVQFLLLVYPCGPLPQCYTTRCLSLDTGLIFLGFLCLRKEHFMIWLLLGEFIFL